MMTLYETRPDRSRRFGRLAQLQELMRKSWGATAPQASLRTKYTSTNNCKYLGSPKLTFCCHWPICFEHVPVVLCLGYVLSAYLVLVLSQSLLIRSELHIFHHPIKPSSDWRPYVQKGLRELRLTIVSPSASLVLFWKFGLRSLLCFCPRFVFLPAPRPASRLSAFV
ncbi:hypothetical protein F5148DRAFT_829939 [Russula earlei]|uniref:Uncharacterized protein n=1 Tax=Russula earlei TaxID=71964 RepID=A0ACC0TTH5_9AGAM|nr:hypothetical protein F5148DRAFT_829939 [Russula earlei]